MGWLARLMDSTKFLSDEFCGSVWSVNCVERETAVVGMGYGGWVRGEKEAGWLETGSQLVAGQKTPPPGKGCSGAVKKDPLDGLNLRTDPKGGDVCGLNGEETAQRIPRPGRC